MAWFCLNRFVVGQKISRHFSQPSKRKTKTQSRLCYARFPRLALALRYTHLLRVLIGWFNCQLTLWLVSAGKQQTKEYKLSYFLYSVVPLLGLFSSLTLFCKHKTISIFHASVISQSLLSLGLQLRKKACKGERKILSSDNPVIDQKAKTTRGQTTLQNISVEHDSK